MQPRDIIKKPLNVDSERLIKKLNHIKFNQSAVFEDIFKNSIQMSKLIKNQKELEKKSREQTINNE